MRACFAKKGVLWFKNTREICYPIVKVWQRKMSHFVVQKSRNCLTLTVAMVSCLILLINVSFKIITLYGFIFSASSVLCAIVAALYVLVLSNCSIEQQRHILNQSLLSLYLFSIGIFLLVNLPADEYMRDNTAYQIVFEDIPRKFFSATLAYGLSFYLPHLFCCAKYRNVLTNVNQRFILAFAGGVSFFVMDFLLLFADLKLENIGRIFIDSSMINLSVLLICGVFYFAANILPKQTEKPEAAPLCLASTSYHYLISFSVTVLLICLACEYRLVDFSNGWTLVASGILFPLVLMTSNLIGELYGYKANLRFAVILVLAELAFDGVLMLAIVLPAPDFFDLNPFYAFIMPRRIPATALGLLVSLVTNSLLLHYLSKNSHYQQRWLRISFANIIVNSLLCLVNYSLLFAGIYPYEEILNLVINAWIYKFIVTLLLLPVMLWLYNVLSRKKSSFFSPAKPSRNNH